MKETSLINLLYFIVISLFSQNIQFDYFPIDFNVSGHREIADIDRDGFNNIITINHNQAGTFSIALYKYPG